VGNVAAIVSVTSVFLDCASRINTLTVLPSLLMLLVPIRFAFIAVVIVMMLMPALMLMLALMLWTC
jgi:hypothetical protein